MMGRAPEGGCGTDERPCRPKAKFPEAQLEKTPTADKKPVVLDVDFFSQARKALCERSPFDVTEDGPGSSNSGGLNISTLPSGLASLLRPSDARKKHKKSHPCAEKKSSRASERSKGGNIWVKAEEYFRDLALLDIDALFEISFPLGGLAAAKCFLIPFIEKENCEKIASAEKMENADNGDCFGSDNNRISDLAVNVENVDGGECVENSNHVRTESAVNMEENVDEDVNVNCGTFGLNGNGVKTKLEVEHLIEIDSIGAQSVGGKHVDDGEYVGNDKNEKTDSAVKLDNGDNDMANYENVRVNKNGIEANIEDEHLIETDSVGAQGGGSNPLPMVERRGFSGLDLSSGLGWLLGCRDRILLTSERPSKKRKLLGTDAGLDKLLIGYPCDGNSSLCDFCCKGETDNDANPLNVCHSCKVAVHHMCYGVQGETDKSWLCSWCKQRTEGSVLVDQLCVICAKQGGALKPIGRENDRSFNKFAHLFCSEWMPEVYVEDLRSMEPIVNVEGILETRKKLVCNICKAKCGACVQCSHGTCRTAFHPICAREARHRMEVWGKYGSDNVELQAFCARHSEIPDGRSACHLGDHFTNLNCNFPVSNNIPVALSTGKEQKLEIGQDVDKVVDHVEPPQANSSDNLEDCELQDTGLSDSRSNAMLIPECGNVDQLIGRGVLERSESEDANPSSSVNPAIILKKVLKTCVQTCGLVFICLS
uniref:PHD finger protein 14-like n=1 Tax=Rhizophora mucronata TaxID=61149 RepID=A0A2P2MIM3_RHIMU